MIGSLIIRNTLIELGEGDSDPLDIEAILNNNPDLSKVEVYNKISKTYLRYRIEDKMAHHSACRNVRSDIARIYVAEILDLLDHHDINVNLR